MMKLRLAQPEHVIDINGLSAELGAIRIDGTDLVIGAMARHNDVLHSAVVGEHFPVLHDAERVIADPVVRNRDTVGRSLCQADPAEDLSAALSALHAVVTIRGAGAARGCRKPARRWLIRSPRRRAAANARRPEDPGHRGSDRMGRGAPTVGLRAPRRRRSTCDDRLGVEVSGGCRPGCGPIVRMARRREYVNSPNVNGPDLADVAARLAQLLRAGGVGVTPDRAGRFAAAVDLAGPTRTGELYWLGRVRR